MKNYVGPPEESLKAARGKWGFENSSLDFIRGNENWVYQFDDYIFRFTANYHRDVNEIQAELDWITYLANQGLSVSIPVESRQGLLVEKICETWACVVFKKAPGAMLKEKHQMTPDVFSRWGKFTGALHKATRSFSPGKNRRHHWNEDDGFILSQLGLEKTDPSHPTSIQYREVLRELSNFRKDEDAYGLIHGDFHHGNFHYDHKNDQITLFDFDDCNYFWFAFDLAVPFASLELSRYFRGLDLDYRVLQELFMESYHKEYGLDSFWVSKIPLFMKYRFANLYFWSQGRSLKNRVNDDVETLNFMSVCEKLTSKF